jgi:hypothetical protein
MKVLIQVILLLLLTSSGNASTSSSQSPKHCIGNIINSELVANIAIDDADERNNTVFKSIRVGVAAIYFVFIQLSPFADSLQQDSRRIKNITRLFSLKLAFLI